MDVSRESREQNGASYGGRRAKSMEGEVVPVMGSHSSKTKSNSSELPKVNYGATPADHEPAGGHQSPCGCDLE